MLRRGTVLTRSLFRPKGRAFSSVSCPFRVPDMMRSRAPVVQDYHGPATIKGLLSDAAGSFVDRRCISPPLSFKGAMKEKAGIEITLQKAREDMGIAKDAHIKKLYKQVCGHEPSQELITSIHKEFLHQQLNFILKENSLPVPHLLELFQDLEKMGITCAVHSAYSRKEVDIIKKILNDFRTQNGLPPIKHFISNDDVAHGRDAPSMIHRAADGLGLKFAHEGVVLDDSEAGMRAGVKGGFWVIAALDGNLMGMNTKEDEELPSEEMQKKYQKAASISAENGAHYVVADVRDIARHIIPDINRRMAYGERPTDHPLPLKREAQSTSMVCRR